MGSRLPRRAEGLRDESIKLNTFKPFQSFKEFKPLNSGSEHPRPLGEGWGEGNGFNWNDAIEGFERFELLRGF